MLICNQVEAKRPKKVHRPAPIRESQAALQRDCTDRQVAIFGAFPNSAFLSKYRESNDIHGLLDCESALVRRQTRFGPTHFALQERPSNRS